MSKNVNNDVSKDPQTFGMTLIIAVSPIERTRISGCIIMPFLGIY